MSAKQVSASKWLGKRMAGARGSYITASIFTLLSAGSFVVFSWYLAMFSSSWLDNGIILPKLMIYAAAFLAGRYIFAHFESRSNYNAGNKIVEGIKKELFPVLLQDSNLDSTSSALYMTKISDDLRPYFAFFVPYSVAVAVVSSLLLVVCFMVEKWVAIILLVSLFVIPIQMAVVGVGAESIHKKHTNLFLKYSAVFYNRLHTIAEIVNLNNFKHQYRFLSRKSEELNDATIKVMRVAVLSSAVLELFVTIAIAAIAIYLGMSLMGIMNGPNYGMGYDFGTSLFLLTITPYFFFYLRKFVSAYHDRNKALAAADLLIPLLGKESEEKIIDHNEIFNDITINNLNFSYPDSPVKVLHNIHQHFPKKGLVLIKGISGSGKSTLLKICTGNLAAREGIVSVNGKDNSWSRQWLKTNSSYMNQFPFIFDGTIRYNVFLDSGLADDFIKNNDYPHFLNRIIAKKDDAWDSQLSHNGKQLSGGERQLVTLARMMLHSRPVAILDEPTANLDSDTAEVIISEIAKMAEDRLAIVASHEQKFEGVADTVLNLNWGEQMSYA